jgi:hypothetical protein
MQGKDHERSRTTVPAEAESPRRREAPPPRSVWRSFVASRAAFSIDSACRFVIVDRNGLAASSRRGSISFSVVRFSQPLPVAQSILRAPRGSRSAGLLHVRSKHFIGSLHIALSKEDE